MPMRKKGGSGGCLGAPFRALSRACDSACDLYVRGMSGCARRVPSGMEAVAVGRGFGRSPTSMQLHLRVSSDRRRDVDDLVRAASKQRRVAAEPAGPGDDSASCKKERYSEAAAAGKQGLCMAPAAVPAPRKKGAGMGTIAEDEPCEFVADGVWAGSARKETAPMRRGATADGLAARAGGFGAIKVGTEAFAR
ncbi:hypothetical protein GUJ93_ZPchr0001g31010 [Zizania palustris]|uniref:Uncharacterized protein n=1 Tax=Zizania palustris TaxID=103762 RepID=A0A8J5V8Z5_ZIZPA|nr:hypothetical protein GUJ93_ZPchr0001g31010 [Zizania palustris]